MSEKNKKNSFEASVEERLRQAKKNPPVNPSTPSTLLKNILAGGSGQMKPSDVIAPYYGNKRPDGSTKGTGFLGEIKLPNGGVASEYSTQSEAVQVDGKQIDFPTLVPTLSKDEILLMQNEIIPNEMEIPEEIMQKAIEHAKMRLAKKQSPFK